MKFRNPLLVVIFCFVFTSLTAQKYQSKSDVEVNTKWNGAAFSSSKTFTENIKDIESFSFLNAILEDENLKKELLSEEMVTIFAPLDASFNSLKNNDLKELLGDKSKISNTIKFLVVPGRIDFASIKKAVSNGKTMQMTTLSGDKLGARMKGDKVFLYDDKNNSAELIASNFYHKNGLFHIVDGLVYPN